MLFQTGRKKKKSVINRITEVHSGFSISFFFQRTYSYQILEYHSFIHSKTKEKNPKQKRTYQFLVRENNLEEHLRLARRRHALAVSPWLRLHS